MKNRKLFIVGIDVSRSLTERSFGTSNLSRHQCDQMLELKVAQIFPKVDKKVANTVFTKQPKKLAIIQGFFCQKFCYHKLSKIAQSGHTARHESNFWSMRKKPQIGLTAQVLGSKNVCCYLAIANFPIFNQLPIKIFYWKLH